MEELIDDGRGGRPTFYYDVTDVWSVLEIVDIVKPAVIVGGMTTVTWIVCVRWLFIYYYYD